MRACAHVNMQNHVHARTHTHNTTPPPSTTHTTHACARTHTCSHALAHAHMRTFSLPTKHALAHTCVCIHQGRHPRRFQTAFGSRIPWAQECLLKSDVPMVHCNAKGLVVVLGCELCFASWCENSGDRQQGFLPCQV